MNKDFDLLAEAYRKVLYPVNEEHEVETSEHAADEKREVAIGKSIITCIGKLKKADASNNSEVMEIEKLAQELVDLHS